MLYLVALLLFAAAIPADHAFDAASAAATSLDFAKAKELYRIAATQDPDPKQRDLAAVRLANIEWRIDRDAAAAEKDLARVADASEQAAPAWIERARLNIDSPAPPMPCGSGWVYRPHAEAYHLKMLKFSSGPSHVMASS